MATFTTSASISRLLDEFAVWATRDRKPQSKQVSDYTAKRYRRYVEMFIDRYGNPLSVTKQDFSKWRAEIETNPDGKRAAAQTVNAKIAALRTFYEFLVDTGRRRDNPSQTVTMEKVPSRKPRFLPRDVIEKLFEEVYRHENNLQDRAILEVLYGSGLRREETGRLTLANIVERDKLRVIGKRNVERYTIITNPEYLALRDHCINTLGDDRTLELAVEINEDAAFDDLRKRMPEAPVFYTAEGVPLTELADPGKYIWKRVMHYANLIGEEITPHQFRHSFATHLLSEGIDIYKVSKMLGHRDIRTTTIYLGLEDKVFDEVRRAHPRTGAIPAWAKAA